MAQNMNPQIITILANFAWLNEGEGFSWPSIPISS